MSTVKFVAEVAQKPEAKYSRFFFLQALHLYAI